MIITATKDAADELEEVTDSYTLYITKKPADKTALVEEIRKAMREHGNEVDLNYIDTFAITNMSWLFSSDKTDGYGLDAFNGTISKWDVSAVTTMQGMFHGNTAFNSDISQWWNKLGKVTTMTGMFYGAKAFNSDISKWEIGSVTTMNGMFQGATAFNKNLDSWGSRLNGAIKNSWDKTTTHMFKNSGLAKSLPSWCVAEPNCKIWQ